MILLDNFKDVRGCVLDIKKFQSSILFNTPSDALISSLFIKYVDSAGVPLSLFDDLLALLHHADFRADGVTLYKSEDIMDRIADQRRLVARKRNGSKTYDEDSRALSTSHFRPSTLIPELVAEYVDSQRVSFHESIQITRLHEYFFANRGGLDVEKILRTMSLVHRSWTDSVQHFLWRCITIFDDKTLRYVFQSPRIGPWVRTLRFHASDEYSSQYSSLIETKETTRLLCGILKRCPNITRLYLESLDLQCALTDSLLYPSPPSQLDSPAYDVLSQISDLKCLEHLALCRLHSLRNDPRGFSKLCAILPCLPRLKSLSVERCGGSWHFGREMPNSVEEPLNIQDLADMASPSEMLTSLSLVDVDSIVFSLLTWLTKPDGGRRVTTLKLSMLDLFRRQSAQGNDRGLATYLRHSFKTEMRNITYLQLVHYDDPYSEPSDIELFLQIFPSLQTLSLCQIFGGYTLPRKYFVLPNYIRTLHFHLLGVSEQEDPHALGILRANPLLRHMFITYLSQQLLQPPIFKDTSEFCDREKIEFGVTEVCTRPHFPVF